MPHTRPERDVQQMRGLSATGPRGTSDIWRLNRAYLINPREDKSVELADKFEPDWAAEKSEEDEEGN